MPGVSPQTEAAHRRGSVGETSCLQNALRTCPGPALALQAPGQMGKPEAAQHVGQVYSHLPHTEPSYPKQNRKEQKQRVSATTAQAGAGPPGPGGRGHSGDRQMDTHSLPSGRCPNACVCVCQRSRGKGATCRAVLGASPWAALALWRVSERTQWRSSRATPVTKERLRWPGC